MQNAQKRYMFSIKLLLHFTTLMELYATWNLVRLPYEKYPWGKLLSVRFETNDNFKRVLKKVEPVLYYGEEKETPRNRLKRLWSEYLSSFKQSGTIIFAVSELNDEARITEGLGTSATRSCRDFLTIYPIVIVWNV